MKKLTLPSISASELTALVIIVILIGVTVAWQRSTESQQQAIDAETESTYVSPAGEFQFTAPIEWTVGENSTEEDGIVRIELLGPRNSIINRAYAEAIGDEDATIEDAFLQAEYDSLFNTSVGKEFALLQIEVVSSTTFSLPDSKDEWREELTSAPRTVDGFAFSKFEDYSVTGADGYKYDIRIFEGERTVAATSYYLLGDLAEAEIILYPADSNFAQVAETIVESFIFTTSEDVEKLLEEQVDAKTSDSDETVQ